MGAINGKGSVNHSVIIAMAREQTISTAGADKVFISAVTPIGAIDTAEKNIKKVVLVLSFSYLNTYAGDNSIKVGTWQIKIGAEDYAAIPFPMSGGSGVYTDGELPCQVEGGGRTPGYKADVTALIFAGSENLGSAVSIKLKNGEANQDSIKLTDFSTWYEVLEENV